MYSRRLGVVADTLVSRVAYDNARLVPYVGRLGWVLEYPEEEEFSTGQVKRKWTPILTDPQLLVRQLRKDSGCYRARFVLPHHPQIVYPDASVLEEDFRWDYSLVHTLYVTSVIYRLDYLDRSSNSWSPCTTVPIPWDELPDSETLYRLVEPDALLLPRGAQG